MLDFDIPLWLIAIGMFAAGLVVGSAAQHVFCRRQIQRMNDEFESYTRERDNLVLEALGPRPRP